MSEDKKGLARVILAVADDVSSTPEKSREYLESEGVEVDDFVERHLARIRVLTAKHKARLIEHRAGMISLIFLSEVEKEMDRLGLTKTDLAKMLGTSKSYLTQLWRGDKYVNVTLLARIENALKMEFKIVTSSTTLNDKDNGSTHG